MANVCDNCGEVVYKTRFSAGKFFGVDCRCAREAQERRSAYVNPYGDLRLEHVFDERGNKVRVTSSRQLSAAEQRYNFASVVRNMDSANIDRPPQQRPMSVGDIYRRKFPSYR